jgi:hypothetical protein
VTPRFSTALPVPLPASDETGVPDLSSTGTLSSFTEEPQAASSAVAKKTKNHRFI